MRQTEYLVILNHFLPFYPLTAGKIKILKKWIKHLEISSFYTSTPKTMIICYTVPEIWHVKDVTVIFHFWLFFALLPSNSPKNCIPKIMIRWCRVPEIWCTTNERTDGQTGQMKKVTYRGKVFQIATRGGVGGGVNSFPLPVGGGGHKFCFGKFFYRVVGTWGVVLTIRTFFKAKNSILWILNTN